MDASQIEGDGGTTSTLFVNMLLFIYLILNLVFLLPLCVVIYYTLAKILPTIAAASAASPSSYAPLPLSDLESDAHSSPAKPREPSVFRPDLTIRPMLSQLMSLRTQYRYLSFFRGIGIQVSIEVFEYIGIAMSRVIADKLYFGPILSVVLQLCWTLALVQLYALWTHTVLTHPSSKSLRQRILPFTFTLRATGLSLVLVTASRLLITYVLVSLMGINIMAPIFNPYKPVLGIMYAAGLSIMAVAQMPAYIILVRIHASLLPPEEKPIFPLDEALVGGGKNGERRATDFKEACSSLGWDGWKRLGMLYGQVSALAMLYNGALFWLNLRVALYLVQLKNGTL